MVEVDEEEQQKCQHGTLTISSGMSSQHLENIATCWKTS